MAKAKAETTTRARKIDVEIFLQQWKKVVQEDGTMEELHRLLRVHSPKLSLQAVKTRCWKIRKELEDKGVPADTLEKMKLRTISRSSAKKDTLEAFQSAWLT